MSRENHDHNFVQLVFSGPSGPYFETNRFKDVNRNIKRLDDLMITFPGQLDLNDKLLDDTAAKIFIAEKKSRIVYCTFHTVYNGGAN